MREIMREPMDFTMFQSQKATTRRQRLEGTGTLEGILVQHGETDGGLSLVIKTR